MRSEVVVEERRHGDLHYLVAGDGPVLIAFHGALGNAESMRWFVSAFAGQFRVIVPSLGDTSDVDRFCDGVSSILDAENVHTAALFGISFGGLLAQAFVARHGRRVSRLILMSCGVTRRLSTVLYVLAGLAAQALPEAVVRAIVRLVSSRRLIPAHTAHAAVRRAVRAHRRRLEEFSERVQKDLVVSRFRITADIHRGDARVREGMRAWRGETLVLVAADDPLISARARARVRDALPAATIHTFGEGGHLIPLINGEEMHRIITGFASPSESV
jgi:pimeloyl-ACP methyl ester carboxylesterase